MVKYAKSTKKQVHSLSQVGYLINVKLNYLYLFLKSWKRKETKHLKLIKNTTPSGPRFVGGPNGLFTTFYRILAPSPVVSPTTAKFESPPSNKLRPKL